QPAQITDVLLTHVHPDHTGGLVIGGKLMFPNATVHAGKPDVDLFLDRDAATKLKVNTAYVDSAVKTFKPYVDANKVKPFTGTVEIIPGLTAELHPGHTPGSAFYKLVSNGQQLTFVGDIVHAAPVQLADPEITIAFDVDTVAAAKTRIDVFEKIAKNGELIASPHIAFPGVGRITKVQEGYEWLPINYGNRNVPKK
ncbi:MAG: MBL fold metallo-hydrolase, partial [Xanthobacteraceae bacterium]|nr:MBL fold metallo-hydrolase [Xanthobacteraceae bacterium]